MKEGTTKRPASVAELAVSFTNNKPPRHCPPSDITKTVVPPSSNLSFRASQSNSSLPSTSVTSSLSLNPGVDDSTNNSLSPPSTEIIAQNSDTCSTSSVKSATTHQSSELSDTLNLGLKRSIHDISSSSESNFVSLDQNISMLPITENERMQNEGSVSSSITIKTGLNFEDIVNANTSAIVNMRHGTGTTEASEAKSATEIEKKKSLNEPNRNEENSPPNEIDSLKKRKLDPSSDQITAESSLSIGADDTSAHTTIINIKGFTRNDCSQELLEALFQSFRGFVKLSYFPLKCSCLVHMDSLDDANKLLQHLKSPGIRLTRTSSPLTGEIVDSRLIDNTSTVERLIKHFTHANSNTKRVKVMDAIHYQSTTALQPYKTAIYDVMWPYASRGKNYMERRIRSLFLRLSIANDVVATVLVEGLKERYDAKVIEELFQSFRGFEGLLYQPECGVCFVKMDSIDDANFLLAHLRHPGIRMDRNLPPLVGKMWVPHDQSANDPTESIGSNSSRSVMGYRGSENVADVSETNFNSNVERRETIHNNCQIRLTESGPASSFAESTCREPNRAHPPEYNVRKCSETEPASDEVKIIIEALPSPDDFSEALLVELFRSFRGFVRLLSVDGNKRLCEIVMRSREEADALLLHMSSPGIRLRRDDPPLVGRIYDVNIHVKDSINELRDAHCHDSLEKVLEKLLRLDQNTLKGFQRHKRAIREIINTHKKNFSFGKNLRKMAIVLLRRLKRDNTFMVEIKGFSKKYRAEVITEMFRTFRGYIELQYSKKEGKCIVSFDSEKNANDLLSHLRTPGIRMSQNSPPLTGKLIDVESYFTQEVEGEKGHANPTNISPDDKLTKEVVACSSARNPEDGSDTALSINTAEPFTNCSRQEELGLPTTQSTVHTKAVTGVVKSRSDAPVEDQQGANERTEVQSASTTDKNVDWLELAVDDFLKFSNTIN